MSGALKSSVVWSIAGALAWAGTGVVRAQAVSAAEDPSLASPAMAVAMPSTAPSTPDTSAPEGRRDESNRHGGFHGQSWFGGMGGMGSPGGMGAREMNSNGNGNGNVGDGSSAADIPDGAEWHEISAFMIDHSPRRWAFYNRLPDGPRQHGMMRVAAKSYRTLQKAKQDDPKLAAVMIESVEAQDAVFGLLMDLRAARRAEDTDKTKVLTADLPAKVGTLVDVSFKERQLRVEQLQRTLDDLKAHLAADQKNRDTVIADRIRALNTQRLGGPPGTGSSDGGRNTDATSFPTASPAQTPVTVDVTSQR